MYLLNLGSSFQIQNSLVPLKEFLKERICTQCEKLPLLFIFNIYFQFLGHCRQIYRLSKRKFTAWENKIFDVSVTILIISTNLLIISSFHAFVGY